MTPTRRAEFAAAVLRNLFSTRSLHVVAKRLEDGTLTLPPDLESFDFGGGEQREMLKELAGQLAEAVEVAEGYKARAMDETGDRTVESLTAQMQSIREQRGKLRLFAQDIMVHWPEGDVDGGDLQTIAERNGMIVPVIASEPCGEGCQCAECGDFPMTCYRKTPLLLGEPPAPKGAPADEAE